MIGDGKSTRSNACWKILSCCMKSQIHFECEKLLLFTFCFFFLLLHCNSKVLYITDTILRKSTHQKLNKIIFTTKSYEDLNLNNGSLNCSVSKWMSLKINTFNTFNGHNVLYFSITFTLLDAIQTLTKICFKKSYTAFFFLKMLLGNRPIKDVIFQSNPNNFCHVQNIPK